MSCVFNWCSEQIKAQISNNSVLIVILSHLYFLGVVFMFSKQTRYTEVVGDELIDWKKIRKEFEESDITARALADKYDIPSSTLYGRKNREKWKRKIKTKKATDNIGGQYGNDNAIGNEGGSAPEGNKNAVSHGLFANYLPKEMLEIISEVSHMTPADMIWQNIMIQYTAIIRSQRIMFVRDEFDSESVNVGMRLDPLALDRDGNPITIEEKREWHMAYEKQERFMNAQSRAMTTLSNLIKQFVAFADENDKRKLELESMQAKIRLLELKAEEDSYDEDERDDGFLEALSDEGAELWPEE